MRSLSKSKLLSFRWHDRLEGYLGASSQGLPGIPRSPEADGVSVSARELVPCALSCLSESGESGSSRHVKFYLTNSKGLSLLCIGGRCNLLAVRLIQSTEYAHMNNIQVVTRFAQGLLAAGVTTA